VLKIGMVPHFHEDMSGYPFFHPSRFRRLAEASGSAEADTGISTVSELQVFFNRLLTSTPHG
jgi:hypothetical protein